MFSSFPPINCVEGLCSLSPGRADLLVSWPLGWSQCVQSTGSVCKGILAQEYPPYIPSPGPSVQGVAQTSGSPSHNPRSCCPHRTSLSRPGLQRGWWERKETLCSFLGLIASRAPVKGEAEMLLQPPPAAGEEEVEQALGTQAGPGRPLCLDARARPWQACGPQDCFLSPRSGRP